MTLKRMSGGAWTDITTTRKRMSGGAWIDIDVIKRRLGGVWVVIWQSINITDQNLYFSRPAGTATTGYRLNSSGIAESKEVTTYVTLETWLTAGTASNYEARATVTSGALSSGTAGSWLNLGTSREWTVAQATVGTNQAIFTVEIRNATTLAVVDAAQITLEAERV